MPVRKIDMHARVLLLRKRSKHARAETRHRKPMQIRSAADSSSRVSQRREQYACGCVRNTYAGITGGHPDTALYAKGTQLFLGLANKVVHMKKRALAWGRGTCKAQTASP